LIHARFDLPEGPFHLFNAHFSWVPEQARLNLDEALPYMRSFRGPAALVGDLNTPPDSDVLQPLREAGWLDVWSELRPTEAGPTFEADNPSLRIDYVWVNSELRPQVEAIEIVTGNRDESGVRLSDHLGLLATFSL
jgi:endonuclease/exonuclease/phosphatase (EEP) superfamily protein YafD